MHRFDRARVLLALVEELRAKGSWAGETHVQKATYFLQHLLGVPLEFPFILYKHGPFSFELRDELASMRVQDFLAWELQAYPYGPSLAPASASGLLKKQFPNMVARYANQIQFVAAKLDGKNVAELERLATGLYVTLDGTVPPGQRTTRIHELKPHVTIPEAEAAVRELDQIRAEAARLQPTA